MTIPDKNVFHTKTVSDFKKSQKTFNKSGIGQVRKWNVYFSDGYNAEVIIKEGEDLTAFPVGTQVTFRIAYRSSIADEIERVYEQDSSRNVSQKDIGPGRTHQGNIIGSPYHVAINVAKDLHIAKIGALGHLITEKDKGYEVINISDLLSDADLIEDWLNQKIMS